MEPEGRGRKAAALEPEGAPRRDPHPRRLVRCRGVERRQRPARRNPQARDSTGGAMIGWRALPEDGGRTLRIAAISFGITAVLGLWLAYQRAGVSPFGVPVFRHLLLFQDYYAIAPFLGILLAALLAPVRALGVALA